MNSNNKDEPPLHHTTPHHNTTQHNTTQHIAALAAPPDTTSPISGYCPANCAPNGPVSVLLALRVFALRASRSDPMLKLLEIFSASESRELTLHEVSPAPKPGRPCPTPAAGSRSAK